MEITGFEKRCLEGHIAPDGASYKIYMLQIIIIVGADTNTESTGWLILPVLNLLMILPFLGIWSELCALHHLDDRFWYKQIHNLQKMCLEGNIGKKKRKKDIICICRKKGMNAAS